MKKVETKTIMLIQNNLIPLCKARQMTLVFRQVPCVSNLQTFNNRNRQHDMTSRKYTAVKKEACQACYKSKKNIKLLNIASFNIRRITNNERQKTQ